MGRAYEEVEIGSFQILIIKSMTFSSPDIHGNSEEDEFSTNLASE